MQSPAPQQHGRIPSCQKSAFFPLIANSQTTRPSPKTIPELFCDVCNAVNLANKISLIAIFYAAGNNWHKHF
jgi:hypothetical protein